MNRNIGNLKAGRRYRGAPAGFIEAFTLIEIIGVVAVIAILAAVLVPRVFSVLSRGRVSATAQSLGNLRTLVAEYMVRSNSLPTRLGSDTSDAATTNGRFDADLLQAGLMDRLFKSSIGNQGSEAAFGCAGPSPAAGTLLSRSHVRSAPGGAASMTPSSSAVTDVNFDLDRNDVGDFSGTTMVVYAYLPGVSSGEAADLNRLIDAETNAPGVIDLKGRCVTSSASVSNTVTAYIFLGNY